MIYPPPRNFVQDLLTHYISIAFKVGIGKNNQDLVLDGDGLRNTVNGVATFFYFVKTAQPKGIQQWLANSQLSAFKNNNDGTDTCTNTCSKGSKQERRKQRLVQPAPKLVTFQLSFKLFAHC